MFAAFALALPVVAAALIPNPNVLRVEMRDARVTEAAAGSSSAVSMMLVNPTKTDLTIVGASTPLAGQTLLQRYATDSNGLMQVVPLDSLRVPAGSEVILTAGAVELQLVGLLSELKKGLELPVTFKFEDGTTRVVRVPVVGQ